MGRQKIEIRKLATPALREAKFKKRKDNVLGKAFELATLCEADISVVLFSPEGTPIVAGNKPIKDMVTRLANSNYTEGRSKQDLEKAAENLNSMDELKVMKVNLEEALRHVEGRMHMLFPQQEMETTHPTQLSPNLEFETSTGRPNLEDPQNQIQNVNAKNEELQKVNAKKQELQDAFRKDAIENLLFQNLERGTINPAYLRELLLELYRGGIPDEELRECPDCQAARTPANNFDTEMRAVGQGAEPLADDVDMNIFNSNGTGTCP